MLTTEKAQSVQSVVWRKAIVRDIIEETPRVRSLVLEIPNWPGHRPGQHVEVRLSGNGAHRARRSFSIASAPEASRLLVTFERTEQSEVSRYLAGKASLGSEFELRGPIGEHFVWDATMTEPLFLVAGGSGIAPLMAMLRHRALAGNKNPAALLYSSCFIDDIIYRKELERIAAKDDALHVVHALTRQQPAGWSGENKRIDREMLSRVGFVPNKRPHIFVCGSTQFVESVVRSLTEIGHSAETIKTERSIQK